MPSAMRTITSSRPSVRRFSTNRAARHNYHLLQTFECGIALTGTEVKSARAGKVNLKEGYARVQEGEVFLHGGHISPYTHGGRENPDPVRVRKLLLYLVMLIWD